MAAAFGDFWDSQRRLHGGGGGPIALGRGLWTRRLKPLEAGGAILIPIRGRTPAVPIKRVDAGLPWTCCSRRLGAA